MDDWVLTEQRSRRQSRARTGLPMFLVCFSQRLTLRRSSPSDHDAVTPHTTAESGDMRLGLCMFIAGYPAAPAKSRPLAWRLAVNPGTQRVVRELPPWAKTR